MPSQSWRLSLSFCSSGKWFSKLHLFNSRKRICSGPGCITSCVFTVGMPSKLWLFKVGIIVRFSINSIHSCTVFPWSTSSSTWPLRKGGCWQLFMQVHFFHNILLVSKHLAAKRILKETNVNWTADQDLLSTKKNCIWALIHLKLWQTWRASNHLAHSTKKPVFVAPGACNWRQR